MLRSIAVLLLLSVTWANAHAVPSMLAINKLEETQILPAPSISTTVDHYTLGSAVDGSVPIYQYQNLTIYDEMLSEVIVRINYPAADSDDPDADTNVDADANSIITQVSLYLEGSEGFESQVYVIVGGIGERTISLQIVARNTAMLRYMIIIDGQKV